MPETQKIYHIAVYMTSSWLMNMVFDYDFAKAMKEPGYFKGKKVEDDRMRIVDIEGHTVIYNAIAGWHVIRIEDVELETGEGTDDTQTDQTGTN